MKDKALVTVEGERFRCRLLVTAAEMDVSVATGGRLLVDEMTPDRMQLLSGAALEAFLAKHPYVAELLEHAAGWIAALETS